MIKTVILIVTVVSTVFCGCEWSGPQKDTNPGSYPYTTLRTSESETEEGAEEEEEEEAPEGLPVLTINSPSITEGDDGFSVLVFMLTLSRPSTNFCSVEYDVRGIGTARSPLDYTHPAGSALRGFDPGQTVNTVAFLINGDTDEEDNETIVVDLYWPTNVILGNTRGVGTILNDD